MSRHLPAILEGDQCNLACAIVRGEVEHWRDLSVVNGELVPCTHPTPQ